MIRADVIVELVKNGVPMDVYGHGWEKHLTPSENLSIFDAVYQNECWEKMRSYRLQINIFRPHNVGSHNMRTFEIPAVGGIMLAPNSPQHQAFFTEGKEALFYSNQEELIEKAKYILNMPAEQTSEVRRQARQRSIISGYDYEGRTKLVVKSFQKLMGQETPVAVN